MHPGIIIFDRIVSFVVGLLLLAAGVFTVLVYYRVDFAADLLDRVDLSQVDNIISNQWYPALLIATTVLCVLLGLWLITANSRPYSASRLGTGATVGGPIQVSVKAVLDAAAQSLESNPGIESVDTSAKQLNNRIRADIKLLLAAGTTPAQVAPLLAQMDQDLLDAGVKVDTRYRLHQAPVEH